MHIVRTPGARLIFADDPGGARRILIAGSLTAAQVAGCREPLLAATRAAAIALDLDLSLVLVADTAGLALLIEVLQTAAQRGLAFPAVAWGDELWSLANLCGLGPLLKGHPRPPLLDRHPTVSSVA